MTCPNCERNREAMRVAREALMFVFRSMPKIACAAYDHRPQPECAVELKQRLNAALSALEKAMEGEHG